MENTTSALIDLRKCNDDQVGELENKTEEGKCQDIQITVSTMKDNLINCLKEDVEKLVESRTKELGERKKKT